MKKLNEEVLKKIKAGQKLEEYEVWSIDSPKFPTREREDFKGDYEFDTSNFTPFLIKVRSATKKKFEGKPVAENYEQYICYKNTPFYKQVCELLQGLTNGNELPKADGGIEKGVTLILNGHTKPVKFDVSTKEYKDVCSLLKSIEKYSVDVMKKIDSFGLNKDDESHDARSLIEC